MKRIPGLLLKLSPAFLGPLFLLIPSPEESPYKYYQSYSLFLIMLLSWFCTLQTSKRINPDLTKTKKFFFTTYTFVSIVAVLGCLTLLRERLQLQVFILGPDNFSCIFFKRVFDQKREIEAWCIC